MLSQLFISQLGDIPPIVFQARKMLKPCFNGSMLHQPAGLAIVSCHWGGLPSYITGLEVENDWNFMFFPPVYVIPLLPGGTWGQPGKPCPGVDE